MTIFAGNSSGVPIGSTLGTPWGVTLGVNSIAGLIMMIGLFVASLISIFLFLGGGLMIITSAGSGDAKGAAQGKQAITWSLIGFLVVVFSYWLIRFLETLIGVPFFTQVALP